MHFACVICIQDFNTVVGKIRLKVNPNMMGNLIHALKWKILIEIYDKWFLSQDAQMHINSMTLI